MQAPAQSVCILHQVPGAAAGLGLDLPLWEYVIHFVAVCCPGTEERPH